MNEPDSLLGVRCSDAALSERAAELAARLGLEAIPPERPLTGLVLELLPESLQLRLVGAAHAPGPVLVDFGSSEYRRRSGSIRNEAIARAVGLKGGRPLRVIDATAGLGRDAFVLASLGAEVLMLERAPIVAALLADGLRRAAADPALADIASRLSLREGEASDLLPALAPAERPEVVYLDPMFPDESTRGQVKKEMQLLRRLLGADADPVALLAAARAVARNRVVVKRPSRAAPLGGERPSHSIEGRSTRFDVYVVG